MEIRCSQCEHVGPASVIPSGAGVALVCENCGHHNLLDVPGAVAAPKPPPVAKPADVSNEAHWLTKGMLKRLVPEAGAGERCPKCAHLLAVSEENCPRCGLSIEESRRYAKGTAPWERPPDGQEAPFEQASLLWASVVENPTDDNLQKFAGFVRDEELLELGIRKLRFFLADNTGHEQALTLLEQLAESFQAKMIVARAKAELRADNIIATTTRLRSIMLMVVFVIFASIFLLFLSQVAGAACS